LLLARVEQVITPGDGVAHGALPRRQVACPAHQQGQALVKARQQRARRQHLDPGGGELDGQRQPVQAVADRGDRGGVLRGEREVGPDAPRPLHEQAHRRRLPQRLDRGEARRVGVGQGQRRHGELLLAARPQQGAARHQHTQRRAPLQQVDDEPRCLHDLFEVVEHQQHHPLA